VRIADAEGREIEARGEGDGPLAAAFAAVDAGVGAHAELEDLAIQAATPGLDAVGEVTLRATLDGRGFTGRGASTDIVHAAVRAYLHVFDKAHQARQLEARTMEATYLWGV
jgi:2-isopropylmalate synthase